MTAGDTLGCEMPVLVGVPLSEADVAIADVAKDPGRAEDAPGEGMGRQEAERGDHGKWVVADEVMPGAEGEEVLRQDQGPGHGLRTLHHLGDGVERRQVVGIAHAQVPATGHGDAAVPGEAERAVIGRQRDPPIEDR